jgi:hypothetical protein
MNKYNVECIIDGMLDDIIYVKLNSYNIEKK